MRLISHRGNISGKNVEFENNPNYIDLAISKGYDVEVDVWYHDSKIWLGHDSPEHPIEIEYFISRKEKLWVHCKNIECLNYFKNSVYEINYFWHQTDDVTITSKGYFWTYPGKKITSNSVYVIDEQNFDHFNSNLEKSFGVCSDNIEYFSEINSKRKIYILLNGLIHNSIHNVMEEYFRVFKNYRIYFIISTWESEFSKIDFSEKIYKIILHKDKNYQTLMNEGFPLTQQLQHSPEDWKTGCVGHYANFKNVLDALEKLEIEDDDLIIKSRSDVIVKFSEECISSISENEVITFPTYWGGQLGNPLYINDHFLLTNFYNIKNIYNPVYNIYNELGSFRNPEMYMRWLIDKKVSKVTIINPEYYTLSKDVHNVRTYFPTDCIRLKDQLLVFNGSWVDHLTCPEYFESLDDRSKNYILEEISKINKNKI